MSDANTAHALSMAHLATTLQPALDSMVYSADCTARNCVSGHAQLTPVSLMQICLIMDEVDGMSGGDRGGVSELIQSIHRSKVPIICICNDKYNQKLRSLRNHTIELDYR